MITYDSSIEYPYPINLLAAIKCIDPSDMIEELSGLGLDRKRGIAAALATLTEQEETIVLLRYKHHQTLEQVGSHYELSQESTQQIIDKALRKMRHPSRRVLLEKGIEEYIESVIEAKVKLRLYHEYMRGYLDGVEDTKAYNNTEVNNDMYPPKIAEILDLPIEEFDLSVRAFNCLKRAGVNKVRDLLTYTTSESIMKIRNLGKRASEEIASRLAFYNVCNEAWASFLVQED